MAVAAHATLEYTLGEVLAPRRSGAAGSAKSLILTDLAHCRAQLERLGITTEEEPGLQDIRVCKLESLPNCFWGTLAVPRQLDVLGTRRRMLLFVTAEAVLIVSDDDFAARLVGEIRRKKVHQGETAERLLYNLIGELLLRGSILLDDSENAVMKIEEQVQRGRLEDFQRDMPPLRKKLLLLRSYFDQLNEICLEFADNENGLLEPGALELFTTLGDRTARLMDRAGFLLDYAMQVKDTYQTAIANQQNSNMQLLTVISVIFSPLTLITGWYGMNFENMPELAAGYPFVILFSIAVVAVCVLWFKRKNMF